jgi:hypothetical protein
MAVHEVVNHAAWIAARKALLAKEKEFTRLRDELSAQRRALPWERVETPYRLEGPGGSQTLQELFDGCSQLIVYHFMLGPEWQAGCKSCSFWADSFDGVDVHLAHRDARFVAVSRAPWPTLEAYQQRMTGELPDYTCLLGTLVQEIYATHPALRVACDRVLSAHVEVLTRDVEAARKRYAPGATWSVQSVGYFIQTVLQGAFIFAKAKQGPDTVRESLAHLRGYLKQLFRPSKARLQESHA